METSTLLNVDYLFATSISPAIKNIPFIPQMNTTTMFQTQKESMKFTPSYHMNNKLPTAEFQSAPTLSLNSFPDLNVQAPLGIVDKYVLLSELGQNHLYPVYLASSIFDSSCNDSNLVVLKAIPVSDFRKAFENESNIFQLKYHKNLLQCTEIIKNARFFFSNPPTKTTESKKPHPTDGYYHILVLKYHANGDLLHYVRKHRLNEGVARYYFSQLLDSLEHLHESGYCHRDLKIENILLDHNFDLVLADFGHSAKHRDQKGEKLFIGESNITTPGICPPEFHKGYGYRGVPMDIFALGKLLLIFITGLNPFKTSKITDESYALILRGQWPTYWKVTSGWMKKKWMKADLVSAELRSLLEMMLCPDPYQRPSIQKIRESAWFQKTKPASSEEVRMEMLRSKNQA
jgi:serine/threonine protein kinase